MSEALPAFSLFFALMNPFLVGVYIIDFIRTLESRQFSAVLMRGGFIACCVFIIFALAGDRVFNAIGIRFGAFQVFGGIVFILIAIRAVFQGAESQIAIRGPPEHLAGAIAMPFLIGPATVSASVLIGVQVGPLISSAIIVTAMILTIGMVIGGKLIYDKLQRTNARLAERYIEIAGRVAAMIMGSIAVDMVWTGLSRLIAESKVGG
jgi:multiple antibiotic resistance protein